MSIVPIGVIHGRFQPIHLGHMEYLLAGKSRCKFLLIGITNPDPNMTAEHPTNPKRSLPSSNPFTYYERLIMIRESLLEAGVERKEFDIVPFPINYPEKLKYYVPLDASFFSTIYDDWGRSKVETLRTIGLKVEVMWERSMSTRVTSGTEVRRLIKTGDKYQHLVPAAVVRIIKELCLEEKVRTIK